MPQTTSKQGVAGHFADTTLLAPRLEHGDACRVDGSCRGHPPHRVLVVGTALEIMGPETRVRDSGEGARPRRDVWSAGSPRVIDRARALVPSGGRQGSTLLRNACGVLLL